MSCGADAWLKNTTARSWACSALPHLVSSVLSSIALRTTSVVGIARLLHTLLKSPVFGDSALLHHHVHGPGYSAGSHCAAHDVSCAPAFTHSCGSGCHVGHKLSVSHGGGGCGDKGSRAASPSNNFHSGPAPVQTVRCAWAGCAAAAATVSDAHGDGCCRLIANIRLVCRGHMRVQLLPGFAHSPAAAGRTASAEAGDVDIG